VNESNDRLISRRALLGAGAVAAGAVIAPEGAQALSRRRARILGRPEPAIPDPEQAAALRVLGRTTLRLPGSRPYPRLPVGVDTIPQIEHVVMLMMENHSYDNLFGMLGRGPYQRPRGDGFTIAADGYPANWNPQPDGRPLRAFRMPTTCQEDGKPTQEWEQSHIQYANGTNRGFVISGSGPVAMGYWQEEELPFTYDLAGIFPVGDRWFCSLLGQTDPNRRFLIAATSSGMTDDIGSPQQDATLLAVPPGGTIFERLSDAGISWKEYWVQYPDAADATESLYPALDGPYLATHGASFEDFLADAAHGSLPSFALLDPNFSTQSQEDPQNIAVGEAFLRQVVEALGSSPAWRRTILVVNYDEHGGYYDHVPPPIALAPDGIPPVLNPGESPFDGFRRYGFRVPSVVVGPYAKRDHVSSVVHDHTSVCAFLERKFNLEAMTYRDANANDLTDFIDLEALRRGRPTFPELPRLAAAGDTRAALACSPGAPVTVPPRPPAMPITARFTAVRTGRGQLRATLQASRAALRPVLVELCHGSRVLASRRIPSLGVQQRSVTLHARPGRYTLRAVHGRTILSERTVHVG
jgi:phospholipase C